MYNIMNMTVRAMQVNFKYNAHHLHNNAELLNIAYLYDHNT